MSLIRLKLKLKYMKINLVVFLLMVVPGSSLVSLSPTLFVVFLIVMVVWLIAVNVLAKEFTKVSKIEN